MAGNLFLPASGRAPAGRFHGLAERIRGMYSFGEAVVV